MTTNLVLVSVIALLTIGMGAAGGHMAANKSWQKWIFWLAALVSVAATIVLDIRTDRDVSEKNAAIMSSQQRIEAVEKQSREKIDAIFALLQPRPSDPQTRAGILRPAPKPVSSPPVKPDSPDYRPPTLGVLAVSQVQGVSTRPDAPVKTDVVVQSSISFPTLQLVLECDKDLVEVKPSLTNTSVRTSMAVRQGIIDGHTNAFMYSYGSSVPQFGPANPLVFSIWSKEPIRCKAETF